MAIDVQTPQATGEASEPAGNCLMGNLGWMLGQADHALGSEIARSGEDLSEDVLRGAQPLEDDELPPEGRIERASPGVAAPDLPAPPPGGWPPEGGFSRRTSDA